MRGELNGIFTVRNEVAAKVMFLHLSVILSTGGVSGRPPGQTPPWTDIPRVDSPQADIPRQTATAADGTHPTGMHSCMTLFLSNVAVKITQLHLEENEQKMQYQNMFILQTTHEKKLPRTN